MKKILVVLAPLLLALSALVVVLRKLLARSNTQIHRINQHR
ncbi:hypothetical protein EV643_108363 [Kribbella sp. VKM Ac-2527]|uniref:Uncharacterized protein n=1 Tax=Kribbella caucasensis TaxID=2512215 RepID=A0A4R6KE02_9ACTN|nr:hypothetical protein [Kribbella sp. VKM Ac-2527]TDO48046.1 hypothetical protein EV643_108363 [Kribbella sp. VKM Ac-2527]